MRRSASHTLTIDSIRKIARSLVRSLGKQKDFPSFQSWFGCAVKYFIFFFCYVCVSFLSRFSLLVRKLIPFFPLYLGYLIIKNKKQKKNKNQIWLCWVESMCSSPLERRRRRVINKILCLSGRTQYDVWISKTLERHHCAPGDSQERWAWFEQWNCKFVLLWE